MKDIRSNTIKESLSDYEQIVEAFNNTTKGAVRDLLGESVQEEYAKILSEANEDEYEVEEVDDTKSDEESNDADDTESEDTLDDDTSEATDEETNDESDDDDDENLESEVSDTVIDDDDDDEKVETNVETSIDTVDDSNSDESEWAEFDKYKISDDEYDFSNADDDEIVKVYKLLKDDDHVLVNVDKEKNKVELKDNDTGAEYIVDLGSNNDFDTDMDEGDDLETESRIFEIALTESDPKLGYTDTYQKKDVLTTPTMKSSNKCAKDWSKGVPTGKSRPWGHKDSKAAPFSNVVNEEDDVDMNEGTNVGGFVQQRSMSKSHIPNSSGRKARNASKNGEHKQLEITNEAKIKKIMNKANSILRENEELKVVLTKFKTVLQEAAVTNVNLGQIIKLITENSTTKTEKQEIISRFGKEAKTLEQSNQLYETISRELKKNNVINIDEGKQFTTNGSKTINETHIYQSEDMLNSLDLMHRICK